MLVAVSNRRRLDQSLRRFAVFQYFRVAETLLQIAVGGLHQHSALSVMQSPTVAIVIHSEQLVVCRDPARLDFIHARVSGFKLQIACLQSLLIINIVIVQYFRGCYGTTKLSCQARILRLLTVSRLQTVWLLSAR